MRNTALPALIACITLLSACATGANTKAVEVLDQRTGMTFAALDQPIELLPDLSNTVMTAGKRSTFTYLGPVEWNRMGTISYGLWLHVAPGNDRAPGDIHTPGVVALNLDDGPLTLAPIDAPKLGTEPYHDAVTWGQTAYFDLTPAMLRRMAASTKLTLTVPDADGTPWTFIPSKDTRAPLQRYIEARGIAAQ